MIGGSLIGTSLAMAQATLGYVCEVKPGLVGTFVISILLQAAFPRRRAWRKLRENPGSLKGVAAALGLGIASSPTKQNLSSCLERLAQADCGIWEVVVYLTATHALLVYYFALLGPLLGKEFVLGHLIGAAAFVLSAAALLRFFDARFTAPVIGSAPQVAAASQGSLRGLGAAALSDIRALAFPTAYGLLLGGLLSALGLMKAWVVPATIGGGGLISQAINAMAGLLFSFVTFMSPVGNLFVATYLWKTGIAQAGLVSFIYAGLVSPQRVRLYVRVLGRKEGLHVSYSFALAAMVAGVATAMAFAALGLGIRYKLVPQQLLGG